jgi:coenzyme PQQ precursor peptide PqqA
VIVGPRADELYRTRKGPVFLGADAGRTTPALRGGQSRSTLRVLFIPPPVARRRVSRERTMAWTTPTLVEICIGLEINGYLPAEF